MGWADADGVLIELERRGVLPRHVNEVPGRKGLRQAFSGAVRRDSEERAAWPQPPGEDLTALPTVAIDDADTREVDDAISAWEDDGVLHVAVHIARIAEVIEKDGPLDREAAKRATTVYFPGQAVRMFPVDLTESTLSLEAGADRSALTLICRVGADGLPDAGRFVRSTVRVDERATYESGGDLTDGLLALLHPVAEALRAERLAAGAAEVSVPQLKLTLDSDGEPVAELYSTGLPSHRVVSEFMILYNARLADALGAGSAAALFRLQPKDVTLNVSPADPLFALRARRSLPPTTVSTSPGPHKTMGLRSYTQATSPIRRFGDLLAQRQLLSLLDGSPPAYDEAAVEALRKQTQPPTRRARSVEDERRRYWICRWFENRKGETLSAVVSRNGKRGSVFLPCLGREYPCKEVEDLEVGVAVLVSIQAANPRARTVLLALAAAPTP
jgi:exoribonuclease-2